MATKKTKKELRSFINVEYNYFPKPERDFLLAWFPLDGSLKDEKHPSVQAYFRFHAQHAKHILQITPLLLKVREIQSMLPCLSIGQHDDIFGYTDFDSNSKETLAYNIPFLYHSHTTFLLSLFFCL
jgi:hypothetical protein